MTLFSKQTTQSLLSGKETETETETKVTTSPGKRGSSLPTIWETMSYSDIDRREDREMSADIESSAVSKQIAQAKARATVKRTLPIMPAWKRGTIVEDRKDFLSH